MADLDETFGRWGEPPKPVELSEHARTFLESAVGPPTPRHRVALDEIELPPSRVDHAILDSLRSVVGAESVRDDRDARLERAGGLSYVDLLRQRAGDVADAPDVVVYPTSHDDVVRLLRTCEDLDLAVVPFGGGTSVVGGVRGERGAHRAVVSVAFTRMADLIDVDSDSCLARVGPGITGPVLEPLLAEHGLTLGHLPQSWARASIGGYVVTRSAGQASSGYGRIDEMVEGMTVATPRGSLTVGRAPASAAGPDLRQLFMGSEGTLGIITEVTLRVRRLPGATRYEAAMFPSYEQGIGAFRDLTQAGLNADVMRLSDEEETVANLGLSGPTGFVGSAFNAYLRARKVGKGAMAILGWEARTKDALAARRTPAWDVLHEHGAVSLGRRVGESWRHGRFSGPFLRDYLMDDGYLVETLETATTWRDLYELHTTVLDSLKASLARDDRPGPYVMSHVSHVYEGGASLYFTVLAGADAERPVEQWRDAKRAVSEAISATGATITHHHGVGVDHEPWMTNEIGSVGLDILRAVKAQLDPAGILNPGKLIPPA